MLSIALHPHTVYVHIDLNINTKHSNPQCAENLTQFTSTPTFFQGVDANKLVFSYDIEFSTEYIKFKLLGELCVHGGFVGMQ